MEFPPAGGWSRDTRKQFEGNTMAVDQTSGPEVRLLNLHFFNICRHLPTLKFKPRATDDERYVWGIDGVPLSDSCGSIIWKAGRELQLPLPLPLQLSLSLRLHHVTSTSAFTGMAEGFRYISCTHAYNNKRRVLARL